MANGLSQIRSINLYQYVINGRKSYQRWNMSSAKANNKYIKDYHKNKESVHLIYLDLNNLFGWVMP